MKYGNRTEEGKGRGKKLIGPTVAFFVPLLFYLTEEFFPQPRETPKLSGCEVRRRNNKNKFVQLFIFFINILRLRHCSLFGRESFKGPSCAILQLTDVGSNPERGISSQLFLITPRRKVVGIS